MQVITEIKLLARALRHRNFRFFWFGQMVSLIGTWMQTVAQAWLVLDLTHSSLKLGVVTALQFLPMLVLSFFTGPFIDYIPKRRIIIVCQTVLMLQAFVLAILDWTGAIQYWHILALAAMLGVVNTVDMPARQAFVIELVGREDLMNAIALNSSIFNSARAIGPALAGLAIASFSTAFAFFLNGLSFLAVIWGLSLIRLEEPPRPEKPSYDMLRDTGEALRYIRRTPLILNTILLVAVVSVFAANFNVLVPVFARMELNRDAAAFGFLMSSLGAGALIGAFSLTVLSRSGPRFPLLIGSGLGLSLFLVLIGLQKHFGMTALLLSLCGWCMVTFFGTANSTVQLNTEDRLRGRVMSVYTMAFGGLSPFGSIFAGSFAHWLHAPLTFALGGLISGLFFVALSFHRSRVHS